MDKSLFRFRFVITVDGQKDTLVQNFVALFLKTELMKNVDQPAVARMQEEKGSKRGKSQVEQNLGKRNSKTLQPKTGAQVAEYGNTRIFKNQTGTLQLAEGK
ncbi:hypothetical protein RvY_08788 [Ramazzottius varieornatus]|uniref:Uncharacterized protein n=1 Tax=Ramazzottius varieornatus TaxID=947166 RepID=A0A1D1V756_RAMVA|nr:hypothetical protein RvY_08788 [Ramazzottius varieornatus]